MTFSFRRNLDIRHRLPDRMGQGVTEMAGDIPLVQGFYAPEQRVLLFGEIREVGILGKSPLQRKKVRSAWLRKAVA
jgi:hypothetical protein